MHSPVTLKRTPLYTAQLVCRATMVPFGSWEMPVQYSGIIDEHRAVRQRVGLFDISHMGEILVAGPNAETVLNQLLTNDLRKTSVGQGQYTLLCNEAGGIIDDLIAYRVEPSVFLLIVNAANIEKDFTWLNASASKPVVFDNLSDQLAALALQGPAAAQMLHEAAAVPQFGIARLNIFGKQRWVARTGYTGEDGFEIVCDAADATSLWTNLLERGQAFGIRPCGLGARDTLRLEMCYPLHGNDITEETSPLEAGLTKFVAFEKEFTGRAALSRQKEEGAKRKLVAFKMLGKSPPPRAHYALIDDGRKVGEITSGTQSPSLSVGIGMGYIETPAAKVGTKIDVEIRGKRFAAVIQQKPLLKRNR